MPLATDGPRKLACCRLSFLPTRQGGAMNPTTYLSPEGLFTVNTAGAASPDGTAEGERRRDNALELLRERRAVWVRRAQRALLTAALERGEATADDVAAVVVLPPDLDGRLLGAAPGALAHAGLLCLSGYVRSTRPERHASVIAVWTLADRAAAVAWLRDNPDLPDLDADGADVRQLELFTNDEPATVAAAAGSL